MRTAHGIAAATAFWAGSLALILPYGARAQGALDASLTVTRICAYGRLGGATVVGGNAPIRCEPSAAPSPSRRLAGPASNPVGVVPQEAAPAPGFERVWDDGRVNPGRGVPRPISGATVLGARVVAPGLLDLP